MALKTERIEIRLDSDTIVRIDGWRMRQDDVPSRSEALRRLIEGGLEDHTPEGFRLKNSEKLMTWMLSEILKHQIEARKDQRDAKYDMKSVDLIRDAIVGGHFWALTWELTGVLHNHVDDPKKVHTVVDILDMWSFIEEAYAGFDDEGKQRIEAEVGITGKDPRFLGFDGNSETEYMSIGQFLVDRLGRFECFKGRDFNSHFPTIDQYRRMADAFEPIRKSLVGRGLSPGEVIELLKRD
jgi:uncharacterized protein YfbU (UPF0304 family)